MVATGRNDISRTSMELRGDCEIVIERSFDAPARIVFEAWTKPEFVKRWWAPKSHGVTLSACDADVRAGGAYRYVMRREGGGEMAFSGTYSEVTPYTRLVYTQVFEPMAAAGAVTVTVTFEERDGETNLVSRAFYPSKAVRDTVLATGMEHGMRESMDQLAALVVSLA
jgi:uncharacterized protein YndB with AHSA1/START domain